GIGQLHHYGPNRRTRKRCYAAGNFRSACPLRISRKSPRSSLPGSSSRGRSRSWPEPFAAPTSPSRTSTDRDWLSLTTPLRVYHLSGGGELFQCSCSPAARLSFFFFWHSAARGALSSSPPPKMRHRRSDSTAAGARFRPP